MKNLEPLTESFDYFEEIINSKQRPFKPLLLSSAGRVRAKYSEYEDKVRNGNKLKTIEESRIRNPLKDYLIHCYVGETKPLAKLKKEIIEFQDKNIATTCQYCTINSYSTFDHYLPKEDFSEYAVMAINLLPCCPECNTKKNDFWIEGTNLLFINLYYDPLPSEQYLFCEVVYVNDVPRVRFFLDNRNLSRNRLFRIISTHYQRLNLLERFRNLSNSEITNLEIEIKSNHRGSTRSEIRRMIRAEIRELKRVYGQNYWRAIIKESLISNREFMQSLIV